MHTLQLTQITGGKILPSTCLMDKFYLFNYNEFMILLRKLTKLLLK